MSTSEERRSSEASSLSSVDMDYLSVSAQSGPRSRLYSSDSLGLEVEVPQQVSQDVNTHLEHLSLLNIFSSPHIVRNTGIICTIGELGRRGKMAGYKQWLGMGVQMR